MQDELLSTQRDVRRVIATQALWMTTTQRALFSPVSPARGFYNTVRNVPAESNLPLLHAAGPLTLPAVAAARAEQPARHGDGARALACAIRGNASQLADHRNVVRGDEGAARHARHGQPHRPAAAWIVWHPAQMHPFTTRSVPRTVLTQHLPGYSGFVPVAAVEGRLALQHDLARPVPHTPFEGAHKCAHMLL